MDIEGRQVFGVREAGRPVWTDQVESWTDRVLPELPGTQPWTVIVVPVGDWAFALTFGGGRAAGPADLGDLTYGRETQRTHQIRAARSLNLPMPSMPVALIRDLGTPTKIVDEPDERSASRFRVRTRSVGKRHSPVPELERRLAAALGGDREAGPLGFARPQNAVQEAEAAGSVKLRRAGGSPVVFTHGEGLETIVDRLSPLNSRERVRLPRTPR